MRAKFSPLQRSTLLLCFFAYAAAYTGRLNLSAALPGLRSGIAMSDAQAGLFQTVFALVYAAGQIVNGSLVDKINVRRSIAVGLIVSAACNALFGLTASFPSAVRRATARPLFSPSLSSSVTLSRGQSPVRSPRF